MSKSVIPSKGPADAQEAAWVADEDRFVLQQAKKKAALRVKGGRAQPIDWLAVTLSVLDPSRNLLDDDEDLAEPDLVDPEGLLEGLKEAQLVELEKGIETYVTLEKSKSNQEYWTTIKTIVKNRLNSFTNAQPAARGFNYVASDVDKLLGSKSYEKLKELEGLIRTKLQSNDPIADYWDTVLSNLLVWKAKMKLREFSQSIIKAKLEGKGEPISKRQRTTSPDADQVVPKMVSLYDREVARGVSDNEEIFANEEEIQPKDKAEWSGKYQPRKPRYFNRVQTGYEWNKYNQTHYDAENPPPKVVQGYKFNIFYPDLIDNTKAPTFKIERENGRKRGQLLAPAGEEDTCLIRFIAGAPYEDIAFRIVDKEWDYSAKKDRGYKSSFDKGILQLHFQFKKIFYRK